MPADFEPRDPLPSSTWPAAAPDVPDAARDSHSRFAAPIKLGTKLSIDTGSCRNRLNHRRRFDSRSPAIPSAKNPMGDSGTNSIPAGSPSHQSRNPIPSRSLAEPCSSAANRATSYLQRLPETLLINYPMDNSSRSRMRVTTSFWISQSAASTSYWLSCRPRLIKSALTPDLAPGDHTRSAFPQTRLTSGAQPSRIAWRGQGSERTQAPQTEKRLTSILNRRAMSEQLDKLLTLSPSYENSTR